MEEKKITMNQIQNKWNQIFSNSNYSHINEAYADIGNSLPQFGKMFMNNAYIQNQRLKNIPSKPRSATKKELENSLKNPENSELMLRQIGWDLSTNNYIYYKLLRMSADLPMYKTYAYPKYVPKEEMSTPRFKSDSKIVHKFLDKFNTSLTFKTISLDVKREGKCSYVYRQSIDNTTGKEKVDFALLQKLPSDYIKYTSIGSDTPLVTSFNFMLFFTPGWSLSQFPPIFTEYYRELQSCVFKDGKTYSVDFKKIPNDVELEYKDGEYMYWKELPQDLVFSFASDLSHSWQLPDTIGLFSDLNNLSDYKWLQGALTSSPLTNILVGEAPITQDSDSEGFQNVSLNPNVVDGFIDMYNQIAPGNSSGYFAPFKNFQLLSFPHIPDSNDIYNSALQDTLSSAGLTGILSTEEKPSVAMVKSSQLLLSGELEYLTLQYKKFLNIILENYLGLKYTWEVDIWGDKYTFKDEMFSLQKDIALGVSALFPKLLSAYGLDIESGDCINDWMESTGTYNKFKQMLSAYQTTQNDIGRAKADENNLNSDSTDASISNGQNTGDMKFSKDICVFCKKNEVDDYEKYICEECKEKLIDEWKDNI